MRQIGTIPREIDPKAFSDHLLTLGIATRIDDRPESRLVWVLNEDHLDRARRELDEYVKAPDDPRYHVARKTAEELRREAQRLDRQYRSNVRDFSGHWDRTNFRRRPLTVTLMAVSIVVYLAVHSAAWGPRLQDRLQFCSFVFDEHGHEHAHGLDDILRGEVWRLITPIFLHFSIIHILFNMWALRDFGSMIEYRRGTRTLAVLVFLSALASNAAQYAYAPLMGFESHRFGGMSGVVYALFGYVWMKGRHEPEQGMILDPRGVQYMLFWLVLCFTGLLGNIANTAHVVGLIIGVLYGLARF